MDNGRMASTGARQVRVTLGDFPEGQVATVTICNASRLNTMNSAMMGEFIEELAALAENRELRAVVLTGDGEKAFIGGADIKEMAALRDSASARAFISRVHACLAAVPTSRFRPSPASRVTPSAPAWKWPLPAISVLHPIMPCSACRRSGSASPRSPKPRCFRCWSVGGVPAKMLLLGENFTAAQALEWKFVERMTLRGQLDDAVQAFVRQALNCAPAAVRLQKSLIRSWEDLPLRAAIAAGIDAFASAYNTDEPQSKMRKFLEAQAERKARA